MDNLKYELSNSFQGFIHSVEDGNTISVSYKWNISAPGVYAVRITLHGVNSLTGGMIAPIEVAVLSPAKSHAQATFYYDGEFYLHFDALDKDKNVLVADFRPPQKLRLSKSSYRPVIEYTLAAAKRGWTRLTVTTNCPERCRNDLWAFYNGHYQQIPVTAAGDTVMYLPASANDIRLHLNSADCPDIPQPQKK